MAKATGQKTTFKERFLAHIGKSSLKESNWYKKKVKKLKGQDIAYEKMFSVIIPVYNVKQYLREAIDSVVVQTVGFKKNIQLILIDDGSTDNSELICRIYETKYPNNVTFRRTENRGVSAARNLAIDLAVGKYIAFLDGDDKYSKSFLAECKNFMDANYQKIDLCFANTKIFEAKIGEPPLCKGIKTNKLIGLDSGVVTSLRAVFFKSSVFKKYRFDETMSLAEDIKLVSLVMKDKRAYGHVAKATYFYRKRITQNSALDNAKNGNNIESYTQAINCYKFLIDDDIKRFKRVTNFTQNAIVYCLSLLNYKSPDEITNSAKYMEAFETLKYCLKNIDDSVIAKAKYLNYHVKFFLLKLKHGEQKKVDAAGLIIGAVRFNLKIMINIGIIEEVSGRLHLVGYFQNMFPELIQFGVRHNGKEYLACHSESGFRTREIYFFGKKILAATNFDIEFEFEKDGYIEYFARIKNGEAISIDVKYVTCSRLNNKDACENFFVTENFLIKKLNKDLLSVKKTVADDLRYELAVSKSGYLNMHSEIVDEYLIQYEKYKGRRIWVFIDLVSKADDNAWWMFQYSKKQNDGVEKYFLISKTAKDWNTLSADPHVLDFDDVRNKVLLLFCEKYFSSHPLDAVLLYEAKEDVSRGLDIYRTLFTADEIFLQHGITKDDVNNRYSYTSQNFVMYLTSGKNEYKYVCGENFNYPEGTIKLLGLPRHDYLTNAREKVIVFAPTWARGHVTTRKYNPEFINSEKYKFIQEFINNKRLYDKLKSSGYKVYCKLHPLYVHQLSDFFTEYNDAFVFINEDITYNEAIKIGSLFITDYSGVVFDFAYLEKPILYCQKLGNHYETEDTYFSYEDHGFGKISYDLETLVDNVIECIEGGCKMPDMYKKRVDEFFTFRDRNNCKRVYDEVIKMPARPFGISTLKGEN